MNKKQKRIFLTGKVINSRYSLEKYLKEKLSAYNPKYNQSIPPEHMLVFIDHFIRIARKTTMEDQKQYLDKLKSIKKRYENKD